MTSSVAGDICKLRSTRLGSICHQNHFRSRFRRAKVYVDCNSFGPRAIEAAVALYGAERIVCGTDGSAFGVDWTRKALAEAAIGEEAREAILHRNAAAMMARVARGAEQAMAAD